MCFPRSLAQLSIILYLWVFFFNVKLCIIIFNDLVYFAPFAPSFGKTFGTGGRCYCYNQLSLTHSLMAWRFNLYNYRTKEIRLHTQNSVKLVSS